VFLFIEIIDLEILHKAGQLQNSPIKRGSDEKQSTESFQNGLVLNYLPLHRTLAIGGIAAYASAFVLWNL
jgi:hypothetical protein